MDKKYAQLLTKILSLGPFPGSAVQLIRDIRAKIASGALNFTEAELGFLYNYSQRLSVPGDDIETFAGMLDALEAQLPEETVAALRRSSMNAQGMGMRPAVIGNTSKSA